MDIEARMVLFGVRVYHTIVDFFNNLCSSKDVYTSYWESVDLKNKKSMTAATREELPVFDVVLHRVTLNDDQRRIAIHWPGVPREAYQVWDLFRRPAPFWFFIGYIDSEENTVDCTDELMPILCKNNEVSFELLYFLIPSSVGRRWVYMPKSLNLVDFPSEGILIGENDKKTD